ncbi:MAG: hypothetical protein RIT45_3789 [Pseudomonadota bacterium]|jgi:dTMP kinase
MARFFVLEGTDGSGTTTQGDGLHRRLGGAGLRTREPSDGPIGRLLRASLRGQTERRLGAEEVALLFAADRIDHVRAEIGPCLAEGRHVVCDRYLGSSLAFQVVDGEGGFGADWLLAINRGVRKPDLTLWIDVPVDEAMARITARGAPLERFEVAATLQRVRDRYAALAEAPPPALGTVVRIDGVGSVETVAQRVWQAVVEVAPELAGLPLPEPTP